MKDEAQQFSLQGEGISVGYQQNIIIPKMDVQIPKGKITSIIGPNGCGKSALLKALSRMMPVQSGAVLLDGQAIATLPTVEVARKMAILPQSPQAPGGLTVEELVSYGRYPHQKGFGKLNEEDHRAIAWALEITHMAEFAQRGIDALSGGQRQRAWIAMALAQDTPLILLDEPTTYLDMAHQLEVLELLKELNTNAHKTIALVIHDLNLAARFSDWMIAMRKGEVLYGKPPIYPYTPIKSSFEDAGSVEEMMVYTELQSAVHAMIQRLEYSFTFNPTLLTIPKRKQQVAEILEEAEKYIWRIKEEMRCA